MDSNPYQTPTADLSSKNSAASTEVTPRALQELRRTRPWVLCLSFLGFLFVALLLVGACVSTIASLSHSLFFVPAAFYLILAILFGLPSLTLCRYGHAIRDLTLSPDEGTLWRALFLHRRFWKTFGIGCIIIFVLMAAAIILIPPLALQAPAPDATFDSVFPEDMDLSEIDDF